MHPTPQSPTPSAPNPDLEVPASSLRVALVDDDPQILEVLTLWLQTFGMKVCSFQSAEALLCALDAPGSHLRSQLAGAILDVNLGRIDGIALARLLRKQNPQLPLVMITALSAQDLAHYGPLPEKTACLHKPFQLTELEDALFAWMH